MPDSSSTDSQTVAVSIVVPLYNEVDNVAPLYAELSDMMDGQTVRYELIFVDDGSRDGTTQRLREVVGDDDRVTLLELTKNFGQTAAMSAGFRQAAGNIIVPIDGDMQNDPHDIPMLVAKLQEGSGWDVVSGWRKDRKDKWLSRKLPSLLANELIKHMTWTMEIHDFGCSLKAYRREVLDDVHLYGEMHRFLPAICKWRGARITEVECRHHQRTAGQSKYGLKRTVKVLLDLLTVKFLGDYLTKPIYFFGKLAMLIMLAAFAILGFTIAQKLGHFTGHGEPIRMNNNILVVFSAMLFMMSMMCLVLGVLAELLVRIYHAAQNLAPYKIRRVIRAGDEQGKTQ
jgi:glycosyltransferase involved in cell wall biosynthesis